MHSTHNKGKSVIAERFIRALNDNSIDTSGIYFFLKTA